jgi:hypothetical protein
MMLSRRWGTRFCSYIYDYTMHLTVMGAMLSKEKYLSIWGFYVRGFKPWHHCLACFYGTKELAIHKDMDDGLYQLPEATSYFYLCGVAAGPRSKRGERNVHLAVRPKAGSVAQVKSVYGSVFTIYGAEEIQIQGPMENLPHLDELYTTCKNFRFAAQMYEAPCFGPEARGKLIRTPREI